MNLKLSYSSKSVVYAGVTPDDFMTNLRVKRVHHDGVNALAFYFHNIKKIGGQLKNFCHEYNVPDHLVKQVLSDSSSDDSLVSQSQILPIKLSDRNYSDHLGEFQPQKNLREKSLQGDQIKVEEEKELELDTDQEKGYKEKDCEPSETLNFINNRRSESQNELLVVDRSPYGLTESVQFNAEI